MKKIKIIILVFMIAVCIMGLSACDFDLGKIIGDIIKDNVWPYSDNGFQEINLNYALFNEDTAVIEWEISASTGEINNSFSFKYYKDKSGETPKEMYVYEKGGVKQTVLILGTEEYYIDNTELKVYSAKPLDFSDMDTALELTLEYGIVKLYDNESQPIWTFLEKVEDAEVINIDEEEEETIKYTYSKIVGNVDFAVYFKKILVPMIVKLEYTVEVDVDTTMEVNVYRIFDVPNIVDIDFSLPTEGYTYID